MPASRDTTDRVRAPGMTIAGLREAYRSGAATPARVIEHVFARVREDGLAPVWISLADEAGARARAAAVDASLPLAGIPFAVKDNVDVAGMTTTAGCPRFAYIAEDTAPVVARLLEAGAILVGKTNMDQFATGLVGVRSPYGACSNVFDDRYISGGSSSGSAVAVARGLCAFALGTDTAGSGRVPAAFNNIVGMKPTRGLLSARGVVPACRSLDCVSIFAATVSDAVAVETVARGFDRRDPYSRHDTGVTAPWARRRFRFGVPRASDLRFFGDADAPALYQQAIDRLAAAGGIPTTVDFTAFAEAASLLYAGPWVAERFAAVGEFVEREPDAVHAIVRDIILSSRSHSAADAFRAAYRVESLKQIAAEQWSTMDLMLLPTSGTIYTRAAVERDPVRLNTNLGYYTNFVNLMDLAALAIPAGFTSSGLPFGVSLIGPAFSDLSLATVAARFLDEPVPAMDGSPGSVPVAVVGAHLSGQPLNHQLTDRGARLLATCRTSPEYKLFALKNTTPAKPGLLRDPGYAGNGIEIEVWSLPMEQFGSFVAAVPPPLAIGSVQLDSGEWVKGFVCEPAALTDAEDITSCGGWRVFLGRSGQVV